jgi:hypothetical protein
MKSIVSRDNVSNRHGESRPIVYSLFILVAVALALVYKLRTDSIFACPATGYGPDTYLSDCRARGYGDYDHGAFWFNLEPEALRRATAADVLFLGSSRLQFGFSGPTTEAWFSGLRVRHYLLGFSHTETTAFVSPLLSKIGPRAKVYVINVDRFFDDRVSAPAGQILQGDHDQATFRAKQVWQTLHRSVCVRVPIVCGNSHAVFRDRDTGAWRTAGAAPFSAEDVSDGPPENVERWDQYAALGDRFISELTVDRSCVLLTLVPTVATKRGEAMAIARRLGLDLVAPRLDGLRTFDGSHLDAASAQRWSAAFFEEAGPKIRKCLDSSQGAGSRRALHTA